MALTPTTARAARPGPRTGRRCRAATAGVAAAAVLFGAGCSMPQPWVKPYERERLADPLMQFSRTTLTEKHREHVHLVREGARGAVGVQGGGCGCN
ncbi:MAG: DUF4266 domain-containing protein [Rubrivivax sp.]|nr:DUF4266 domain-containing protein [Rubrivivax sp.]